MYTTDRTSTSFGWHYASVTQMSGLGTAACWEKQQNPGKRGKVGRNPDGQLFSWWARSFLRTQPPNWEGSALFVISMSRGCWRMHQLKRPLSKPFAIWLLQLLLSQLSFSIAFCSNSEAGPVPVPAVLRKLNGSSFFFFFFVSKLLQRTAHWWLMFSDNCLFSCHFRFTGWGKMSLITSDNCWSGNKSHSAWGHTQYRPQTNPMCLPEADPCLHWDALAL